METKLHTPVTIMEKCIVTGGAGFIGSNLVERLLNENMHVTAVDNDPKRKPFISEFTKNKMFKFLLKDVNDLKVSNIDDDINIVYHLAASADIKKSLGDVKIDLENNVVGTHSVLEIMRQKDIDKMIFSSSSAVYGETKVIPTPENLGDIKPISLYGASKLAAEYFIIAYCHLYGMKAWIFRFANVVGKNEHRGVIFDFAKKLEKNPNELEILGDGNQEKSFFDVSDCISGLIEIPRMDPNKLVEIYNLGNLETMKVTKLAEIVCDELKLKPRFRYTGGDRGWKGDVPITILSIDKALKVGWKPKYDCEKSIRRTVRYLIEK